MANNTNHSMAKHSKVYPNFSLRDRVYVITGGARGLGLAMAEAMTEAGADGKLQSAETSMVLMLSKSFFSSLS
jgi:hypothetical protein